MDRRMAGVLMLALVLLVAAVVPNLQPKSIAGAPAVGPVPPAPKVGQCLLQDPPDPSQQILRQQPFRLGSCKVAHFGEVAEVVPNVPEVAGAGSAAGGAGAGSTAGTGSAAGGGSAPGGGSAAVKDPCGNQAAYLGWTPPVATVAGVRWQPITVPVINMVPVALQRAYGQRWVACVVTPSNAGVSYTGSVKNALTTGRLPFAFASCQVGNVALDGSVTCDIPHRYEIFGTATLTGGYRDQPALDAACRAIVTRATGRADPTAGGALTIRTYPFHYDSTGKPQAGFAETLSAAEAVCAVAVTGTGRLKNSLFGIGSKALPWA